MLHADSSHYNLILSGILIDDPHFVTKGESVPSTLSLLSYQDIEFCCPAEASLLFKDARHHLQKPQLPPIAQEGC